MEPAPDAGKPSPPTRDFAAPSAEEPPVGPPPVDEVLAAYGTLRPGESNFAVVADIAGMWFEGTITGHLGLCPSGHYEGFPAFMPDAEGVDVPVSVLHSPDLRHHWDRLDRFEGPGYRRVEIDVVAPDAPLARYRAYVYELRDACPVGPPT